MTILRIGPSPDGEPIWNPLKSLYHPCKIGRLVFAPIEDLRANSSPFPSFLLLPNLFPISLASLSPHRQLALRSPSKASGEKEFPARYLQLLELRGATRKVKKRRRDFFGQ
ncbi:hypothetical protein OPV22_027624 [Ensete ventricosum]|uniref:Uncharacterized protein n=1 Tax=Ensete ventricosum TaxID=4639 RepID=A0AAV8P5J0_ENSVE|nr:hypothetical protein OPV22_027624 [Ensete ventricosum]